MPSKEVIIEMVRGVNAEEVSNQQKAITYEH